MRKLSESENINHNKFLLKLEEWDEDNVYKYKGKVSGQVFYGYVVMILGSLFTSMVGSMILGIVLIIAQSMGSAWWLHIIGYVVLAIITFFVFRGHGIKKTEKFISINHGEVGQYGHRYYKRMIAHKWITLVLFLLFTGGTVALAIIKMGLNEFLNISSIALLFTMVPFSSFAYFCGTSLGVFGLSHCPVCGRINTLKKYELQNYGDKVDGQRSSSRNVTRQTGTRTTTTYYSDGSTSSTSTPIYSTFTQVTVYDKHSVLSDYMVACSECTYHAAGTEMKTYEKEVGRYEY